MDIGRDAPLEALHHQHALPAESRDTGIGHGQPMGLQQLQAAIRCRRKC